jgi:hypothetical protein
MFDILSHKEKGSLKAIALVYVLIQGVLFRQKYFEMLG